ncbi:helix-turn-helix transcriptional regulator [Fructilactobacillus sp. Tb1]|uniref:helix-turn-helix transcriptional regulator n=1 Tax=Fructilactobacillus sp. Tb1 TaxID=3422304 RepID=UPI003D2A95B4
MKSDQLSSCHIGKNLKKLRFLHNMTQEDLAEKISVSKSTLSHYEIGRRLPDIDILLTISNIFDISLNEILINPV